MPGFVPLTGIAQTIGKSNDIDFSALSPIP